MTREQKELLLKELCELLPYGVFVKDGNRSTPVKCDLECHPNLNDLENIKLYLRPMSSMTDEEKDYVKNRWCYDDWTDIHDFLNNYKINAADAHDFIDWLDKKMFDYSGLIRMGIALEAPEGMYNIIMD